MIDHAALLNHYSLGFTAGSGGVDHIREVSGEAAHRRFTDWLESCLRICSLIVTPHLLLRQSIQMEHIHLQPRSRQFVLYLSPLSLPTVIHHHYSRPAASH